MSGNVLNLFGKFRFFFHVTNATVAILFSIGAKAAGSGGVERFITSTEDAGPNGSYVGFSDDVTYNWGTGDNVILDGFEYNGTEYLADQSVPPDLVAIRRNDNPDSSGERCRVFAEATNDTNLVTTYPGTAPAGTTPGTCSMESVLSGRILNMGTLDLFANDDNDGGRANNNIERVDYITTAGVNIPNIPGFTEDQGIIVNEKSHNNPFQMRHHHPHQLPQMNQS